MAQIINLRMERKRKAKAEKEKLAQQNRLLNGRSRTRGKQDEAARQRDILRLEGHRIEKHDRNNET